VLPYMDRVWKVLDEARRAGSRILFEGAQGTLLDIDHGTYPFVTSSNTVAGQAAAGSGLGPGAIGYVLGTGFNYFTYSRGVFTGAGPAKLRFALSYAGNYLINLAGLKLASHFIADPYLAGAVTTFVVVVLNYAVLKRLVFRA